MIAYGQVERNAADHWWIELENVVSGPERRENFRQMVRGRGILTDREGRKQPCNLVDISISGVKFYSQGRYMIDDFANPEFFPGKLKMMEKKRPQNFLLTGMSDLSGWKPEWRDEVFAKIRENPQHQFLFLTKRPDLLDFDTDLENAWFGVTVTRKAELWRIDALRKNVRAKHYHVTFEPLFDDPGTVDLSGINWIVVGTMTGAQSRKIHTEPEWAWSLADQAHKLGIPVFMKEDLVPIIGDENMIQEMPEEFNKVLEVQKSWKK